jgi:diguanylate cyclase (GGDEF)-like protein
MWLNMHLISLAAGAGAVVVMTFLIFSMGYLFFISHDRISLYYMLLQASFLPYLTGYALYTSGIEAYWILLWYRVCVTGLFLTPFALELFFEALLKLERKVHRALIGAFSLAALALLWFVPSTMATGEITIHPGLGLVSVTKGPAYPYVIAAAFLMILSSFTWFLRRLFTPERLWRQYRFLLAGMLIWMLACLIDALVGLGFEGSFAVPWLGPPAMVVAVGLQVGWSFEETLRTTRRKMQENEILRHKLKFDPLTDLYSREFFNSILEIEAEGWERKPEEYSILFIDADNFKGINDNWGHAVGDQVLQLIGKIIRDNVRRSDIPSRYGGDEFIILLKDCSEDAARILGEKIIREYTLSLHTLLPEMPAGFSGLSIGIASTALWEEKRTDLIAAADEAMYRSKRLGKNCVIVAEKAV